MSLKRIKQCKRDWFSRGQSGKLSTSSLFLLNGWPQPRLTVVSKLLPFKMSLKVPLSVQTAGSLPRKSLAPLHCINNDWVGSLCLSTRGLIGYFTYFFPSLCLSTLCLPFYSYLILSSSLSHYSMFSSSLVGVMILDTRLILSDRSPSDHRNSHYAPAMAQVLPAEVALNLGHWP